MSKGETSYPKSHNLEVGGNRTGGLLVFLWSWSSWGKRNIVSFSTGQQDVLIKGLLWSLSRLQCMKPRSPP